MANLELRGEEIRDYYGRMIGRIVNDKEIWGDHNNMISRIVNNEVWGDHNNMLARIVNDEIWGDHNNFIIRVSDARKEINGSNHLDPKFVAAIWLAFVKR